MIDFTDVLLLCFYNHDCLFPDRCDEMAQRKVEPINETCHSCLIFNWPAPPGWLSGERVGLMTWWLRVRSPVEATFLSGVFSPLTSAEAYGKSSRWLWKEKLC